MAQLSEQPSHHKQPSKPGSSSSTLPNLQKSVASWRFQRTVTSLSLSLHWWVFQTDQQVPALMFVLNKSIPLFDRNTAAGQTQEPEDFSSWTKPMLVNMQCLSMRPTSLQLTGRNENTTTILCNCQVLFFKLGLNITHDGWATDVSAVVLPLFGFYRPVL